MKLCIELGQYIDEVQSSLIAVEEGLTNAQYNANSAKQVADGNTNSELALTNAQNAQLYLYNYGEQKVTTVTPGNVHTEVEGDTTFDFDASTGISMAKEGGNSVEIKPSDQNDKPCLLLRDTGGDAKLQPDLLQMYREDGTPGIFMGADANSLELLQNVSTLQSTIQAAGGLELIANVHDASLEGMHINSNTGDLFISLGGQKYRMYFDQNGFLKGDPV